MTYRFWTLLFILLCALVNSYGQSNSLALKAMSSGDSIMLRWAPKDYATWQLANRSGYVIERILVSKQGIIEDGSKITKLGEGAIRPFEEEKWEQVVKKDSIYAPIALQALLGETFELSSSFNKNIMEAYSKAKENESRFGFALYCADRSLDVAHALGLYFVDKNVRKDERYIYRVFIDSTLTINPTDTAYALISVGEETSLIVPDKPNVYVSGKSILLNWIGDGFDYIGYKVERSFDGKRYNTVSKDLIIPFEDSGKMKAFFMDTLNAKHNTYYYRIFGITPFGISGPHSDTTKVIASEPIDPPSNLRVIVEANSTVKLVWKVTETNEQLSHFVIKRASKADSIYLPIGKTTSAKQMEWIDKLPLSSGYYKVAAVSNFGVESESLEAFAQLNDDTPPAIPIGLGGKVDTLGVVSLSWTPNTEKDLFGYRVFRANGVNSEYVQINDSIFSDASFSDTITLQTLTKVVSYKLAAVDKRYNSSDFSLPFVLKRPDIIKPAPPILISAENCDTGILLKWINSPSDDVKSLEILRYNLEDTIIISSLNNLIDSYIDTTVLDNGIYSYVLSAIDSTGNKSITSVSREVVCKFQNKLKKMVLDAAIQENGNRVSIRLFWDWEQKNSVIRIYRDSGKGFILYKTINNTSQFDDEFVNQGKSYQYMIKSDSIISNIKNITLL